ncbi:flagellar basal body protein [uncultured Acinetobacter sp.]|uniref:flagellar basal body protein n=1 Tax=uncultured Acinetobacter sp. TaxID=165433 RepID=UPI003748D0C7
MNDIASISHTLVNAMNIQDTRIKVASMNIANLNVPGGKGIFFDYKHLMKDVSLQNLAYNQISMSKYQSNLPQSSIKLDEQTFEAVTASGRYQGIAEILNRSYGLMQLAIQGKEF